MIPNDIYKNLEYSNEFSVQDWNELIKIKFQKYFDSEETFTSTKELLRTELINFIPIDSNNKLLEVFEWTFNIFNNSLKLNENLSIVELGKSFKEVSETDMKWMTNVLIQSDTSRFSERDKISYYFKVIDEILEGVFKLLFKFAEFKETGNFTDISNKTFGNLINEFPSSLKNQGSFYLKDPIISISTSQWRNIAAHKSFEIEKDSILLKYGNKNEKTASINFTQFYDIFNWVKNIYQVIRLSQVLIYLDKMSKIKKYIGENDKGTLRFESSLLHIIHNIQIVGFKFISTNENHKTFELNLNKKENDNLKDSMIHASQFLDQLSYSIYDDKFIRENFDRVKVNIFDYENNKTASASIKINTVMKKADNKLSLKEYIDKIDFQINN